MIRKSSSRNGWILPSGEYIECLIRGHERYASKMGTSEREIEKIAVKISWIPEEDFIEFLKEGIRNENPVFIFPLKSRITDQQLETIEEYCIVFNCFPPDDYFIEKNFERENWQSVVVALGIDYKCNL